MSAKNDEGVKAQLTKRYVAYCDILGFSDKIINDFDDALRIYEQFGDRIADGPLAQGVEVTMYSDAILLTSESLEHILVAAQILWFVALTEDLMIRGAIAKGNYWEKHQGRHLFVASDALVRAVKLEQSVGVPAIVLADDIELSDDYWLPRFVNGVTGTPLLHFRDRNIVNPFSLFWFRSAKGRALALMKASPRHQDKYLWFLALHEAMGNQNPLVPPDVWERLRKQDNIDLSSVPRLPGYDGT